MSGQLDRPPRRPRGPKPAPDAAIDPIDYRAAPIAEPATPALAPAIKNGSPTVGSVGPTMLKAQSSATGAALPPQIEGTKRDITVQVNQRVSLEVANVFDEAAKQFTTKRAAIEYAIMAAFGPQSESRDR